jgi:NTE family protein
VQATPAAAICRVAADKEADLIVVGNKGIASRFRRVRAPICTRVQQSAPCAVRVVDTAPYWRVTGSSLEGDDRPAAGGGAGESAGESHGGLTRQTKVLLVSTLAVFMAFLDVTIVNVAMPAIHRSFATTRLTDLSWVLNAYNVVMAAVLVPAGRLADRIGRRRMFFVGLLVFLAGSVGSGLAPSVALLICARVVQAAGAATLIPTSLGLVLAEFPVERRPMATGVWAAAGAVAAAAGPSLGGVLVQSLSWRWVFFANCFFALGMLPARRLLVESRDSEGGDRPDFAGGALLAAAVGALALGIVKAPDWGWASPRILGCWGAGAVLLTALLSRSSRHASPVLEPELLRIRMFALANISLFAFSVGLYALLLGNILFLTEVWGYSILTAGLAVTPGPLMAALAAVLGGRLTERFGPRAVALPALVTFAGACMLYREVGLTPAYVSEWLPAALLSGTSIGMTFAGLTAASVMDLPASRLATGTAVSACFRQIGAVLGIAGLVAIVGNASPAGAMHAFERAWLLMALAALAAAACVLRFDSRRPGESPEPSADRPRRRAGPIPGLDLRYMRLHGHSVAYRIGGQGPAVLLVHGLLEDSMTWRKVAASLARDHTVIAPDLLGHGASDGPLDVDYTLGGHVWMLRDLLDRLGQDRVTVVGHSLGGGIAMAFAGHYPDRVERLALIAPGGFGREVNRLLRMMTLPGAGVMLRIMSGRSMRSLLSGVSRMLGAIGASSPARTLRELARALEQLAPTGGRWAFMRSVRSVIDRRGQCACALDRMQLWRRFDTLIIWGTNDRVIPVQHAYTAADLNPEAEVVLLEGVGHVPHLTHADFVAQRLAEFASARRPAPVSPGGGGNPLPAARGLDRRSPTSGASVPRDVRPTSIPAP